MLSRRWGKKYGISLPVYEKVADALHDRYDTKRIRKDSQQPRVSKNNL